MKFSRFNQPRHRGGRKPSAATVEKRRAEEEQRKQRETQAFEAFETATSGYFDGYSMTALFHHHYDKANALEVLTANDCAEAETSAGATVRAGADGATVYIMTERARNDGGQKFVRYNRSVYAF